MLDASSAPWLALREVEKRWEDDPFYREMRNIAGFHVDPDVVARGLASLEAQPTILLSEGKGPKQDASSIRLGLEALFAGCDKNLDDFEVFLKNVSKDHEIRDPIQEAFLLAVETAGIPCYTEDS